MTKQLTRQEVEAVVEKLANKTLSFGCIIDDKNHSPSKIMFVSHGTGQIYSGIQIGAENTYNFFNGYMTPEMKVLGHPITIGTVLEKIDKTVGGRNYYAGQTTYNDELIHLWSRCGEITQSLQEIIEEGGWEEVRILPEGWYKEQGGCSCHINPPCSFCEYSTYEEVLKSPEANALFSFLQNII